MSATQLPPRRGSFEGAVLAGAHDGDSSRLVSSDPILGLVRDSTYLFATLRDSTGTVYAVMRRHAEPPAWPNRLWTRASSSSQGFESLDLQRTAAASNVTATADGDAVHFAADTSDGDEPLSCLVTPTNLVWDEGAILHLAGADISPGLQWYLPDPDGSMLYASRLFVVEGHVSGSPVRGIAGVDDVFLDPGRRNYVDDPITKRHHSTAWCTWATCYDDGTAESGHAAFGPGRFGFAIRSTNDGAVEVGDHVGGDVTYVDGSPVHALFDIDGEQWEFEVDPFGRCAPMAGPVLQAEGLFRRRGDIRRPIVWSASLEVPS